MSSLNESNIELLFGKLKKIEEQLRKSDLRFEEKVQLVAEALPEMAALRASLQSSDELVVTQLGTNGEITPFI